MSSSWSAPSQLVEHPWQLCAAPKCQTLVLAPPWSSKHRQTVDTQALPWRLAGWLLGGAHLLASQPGRAAKQAGNHQHHQIQLHLGPKAIPRPTRSTACKLISFHERAASCADLTFIWSCARQWGAFGPFIAFALRSFAYKNRSHEQDEKGES